jgi:hypothetical protein
LNLYVHDRARAGRLPLRADDPATWMERYEGVAEDFPRALDEAAARRGFDRFLELGGQRHPERVECA